MENEQQAGTEQKTKKRKRAIFYTISSKIFTNKKQQQYKMKLIFIKKTTNFNLAYFE